MVVKVKLVEGPLPDPPEAPEVKGHSVVGTAQPVEPYGWVYFYWPLDGTVPRYMAVHRQGIRGGLVKSMKAAEKSMANLDDRLQRVSMISDAIVEVLRNDSPQPVGKLRKAVSVALGKTPGTYDGNVLKQVFQIALDNVVESGRVEKRLPVKTAFGAGRPTAEYLLPYSTREPTKLPKAEYVETVDQDRGVPKQEPVLDRTIYRDVEQIIEKVVAEHMALVHERLEKITQALNLLVKEFE